MKTSTIKNSIWLMLPISIIIVWIIAGFNGIVEWQLIWQVPFLVLILGAVIWVPSMIMTYGLESILIDPTSSLKRVAIVFGLESLLTFLFIFLIFASASMTIPMVALGMSIVIQLCRLWFIKEKGLNPPSSEQDQPKPPLRVIH